MITMCEKIVMEVIWDADHDLTIDDIINEINKERAWNKKAVSAFLRRLRKKRFIIRYRHDHIICLRRHRAFSYYFQTTL